MSLEETPLSQVRSRLAEVASKAAAQRSMVAISHTQGVSKADPTEW